MPRFDKYDFHAAGLAITFAAAFVAAGCAGLWLASEWLWWLLAWLLGWLGLLG